MKFDIVDESIDKKHILIGECKWSKIADTKPMLEKLKQKASLLPIAKGKKIIVMLYIKETSTSNASNVFLPLDVLARLK